MKRKLFYVLSAAAVVLTLASCGETKDEKQIKNDLGGKSNQEVVDYVAKQAVSEAAVSKIQSTKGIKATLKEKVKISEKMAAMQDISADGEATAEFVLEYEKGFSLKGSATGTVKGNYNNNSIDAKATASAEVYYSMTEDTLYLNAKAEVKGKNGNDSLDQNNEYKGKILKLSEQFTKLEKPDNVTAPTPDVPLPEEYQQIVKAATDLVASYKERLNFTIEDNQVKIGLDLTKDDVLTLLNSSLTTQIVTIAGLEPQVMTTIKGIVGLNTTTFSSTTKVGFTKDYLLKSIYSDLNAAVKYQGLEISVGTSTDLNLEFGEYTSEEVKDKDSYTNVIEIPSVPSETI